MSTTDSDQAIELQLQALLEHNAPAVTLDEVTHGRRAGHARVKAPNRRTTLTRRRTGPSPALAWAFGLLLLALAGVVIFAEANLTSDSQTPRGGPSISPSSTSKAAKTHDASTPPPRFSDYLHLDETTVDAGQLISGEFIVSNRGARTNLTQGTHGCAPKFQTYLSNGKVSQTVAFTADCDARPFYIQHGRTVLPFTLLTTYTSCVQSGPGGPNTPPCTKSGAPPLPGGRYDAKVEWSGSVPLPNPKPIVVNLIVPPASTATTVMGNPTTQTDTFQPWRTATALVSGVTVIGTQTGGNCWTESILDYANPYAWRCMSGTAIFDPCFAPPGASDVTQVACAASPTGGVYLMTLRTPLVKSSSPRNSAYDSPWYIVLSNGQACSGYAGAGPPTDSGVVLSYGCATGGAAEPDRSTEPWSDKYASTDNSRLETVTVVEVWN